MTWIIWPMAWFAVTTYLGTKMATTTGDFWWGWFWLTLMPVLFMFATRFL